jgi:mono/diheme cytochrome c family protein
MLTFATALAAQTTSMDGVYTDAQAKRGEALYLENCSACHGAELTGDPYAPALSGAVFNAKWRDRSVEDLFDFMRLTMPQTFPNSLTRQQNADLLAYIFQNNRLPAGKTELPTHSDALAAIRFAPNPQAAAAPAPPPVTASAVPAPAPASTPVADGYYTREQADHGRVLFNTWCTPCHVASSSVRIEKTGRGFWLGTQRLAIGLGGRYAQKYPSVYHLFRRVRDSMPSFNADALGPASKVDIVAYLLQQSGFPAGPVELPLDVPLMKSMKLAGASEAGFERVFNGRDFAGLKFLIGPNCRPAPAGCGRTDPGNTFWVENGEIVTNGKIQGYMYTEKKYLNFTLRFDFKHVPPADRDREGDYFDGNSGYLLFVTEHRVWPKGIEIQGNHMSLMTALGMDTQVKAVNDEEAMRRAKKPAGQWQSAEIVSKDGQVRSYLNGTLVSTVTEHEFKAPGHIGFQSEGAELHWRNIRIKEEPPTR